MRLRTWIVAAVTVGLACSDNFDPISKVKSLRVIAVEADPPYASAGSSPDLALTFVDALGPRDIQLTWFRPCTLPGQASYLACLPGLDPQSTYTLGAQSSGVPASVKLSVSIPNALPPGDYANTFVFFALCAGTLERSATAGDGGTDFPYTCKDANGQTRAATDFVAGYTQLFSFRDGRTNANPPSRGISVDGDAFGEAVSPTIAKCDAASTPSQGCGAPPQGAAACTTATIGLRVDDVAELDGSSNAAGTPQREVLWVDYFTDAGSFSDDRKVVSRADTGLVADNGVKWTPPSTPGAVHFWAVLHDSRGGISVARRQIIVQ